MGTSCPRSSPRSPRAASASCAPVRRGDWRWGECPTDRAGTRAAAYVGAARRCAGRIAAGLTLKPSPTFLYHRMFCEHRTRGQTQRTCAPVGLPRPRPTPLPNPLCAPLPAAERSFPPSFAQPEPGAARRRWRALAARCCSEFAEALPSSRKQRNGPSAPPPAAPRRGQLPRSEPQRAEPPPPEPNDGRGIAPSPPSSCTASTCARPRTAKPASGTHSPSGPP